MRGRLYFATEAHLWSNPRQTRAFSEKSDRLLGESEAILLAEQVGARFLLIDDARGRRIARGRGIPVVGVAGVLLSAKSRGVLAKVRPVLDTLSEVGYRLSPRLVAAVLERAGE